MIGWWIGHRGPPADIVQQQAQGLKQVDSRTTVGASTTWLYNDVSTWNLSTIMIAAVMQARENRDLSGNSISFFERSGARGGIPSYSSTTVLRKGRRFWIKALILCQQCTHFVLQLYSSAGTRALQLLRFDFSESPSESEKSSRRDMITWQALCSCRRRICAPFSLKQCVPAFTPLKRRFWPPDRWRC